MSTDHSRLNRLKALPRQPGEASFFYHDAHFRNDAVKLMAGEYFVHDDDDILLTTTLGSCIATCLWDPETRVGGMNHFMLPGGDANSGRYGSYAMELLINEMMKRGARRETLEAKVFGGGQMIQGVDSMNIGERNTVFAVDYLKTERIPIVSRDVLGGYARKVCFLPATGKAMVKRLIPHNREAPQARDSDEAQRAGRANSDGGSADFF